MTEKELAALETAAKATTPGPWRTEGYSILRYSDGIASAQSNGSPEICNVLLDGDYDPKTRHERALHNAAFIAAANPAAVLDLIAELRQARAERDWIAGHCDGVPCNGASCPYPPSKEMGRCIRTPQRQCWLDAAKEATCLRI